MTDKEVFFPGDGVMFIGTEWELSRLRSVSWRHGVSIMEVAKIISETVMAEADPLRGSGEEFVFLRVGFLLREVPEPYANVCRFAAQREFEKDALGWEALLEGNPSLEELASVWRNSFDWILFWSVRHSDKGVRDRLQEQVLTGQDEAKGMSKRVAEFIAKQAKEVA